MYSSKRSLNSLNYFIFSLGKYSEKSLCSFSEGARDVAPYPLYQTHSGTPGNQTAAVPAEEAASDM